MRIASWSGGKDSCFACYLALQKGFTVSHLVHFDRPLNLHGVDPAMIRLQAELAGIPLVQRRVATEDFEWEFKDTVGALIEGGARGMIFGDIYLESHREWAERVCREMGIVAEEPLWGMQSEKFMHDFLTCGFETIVVSGQQKLIDKRWIGRAMDAAFIEYLRKQGLDICGENGEFHTFVNGGPLFKDRIEIVRSEIACRDNFFFLDIQEHRIAR
jgi:uncharacterized protein (TIGR00290 family)